MEGRSACRSLATRFRHDAIPLTRWCGSDRVQTSARMASESPGCRSCLSTARIVPQRPCARHRRVPRHSGSAEERMASCSPCRSEQQSECLTSLPSCRVRMSWSRSHDTRSRDTGRAAMEQLHRCLSGSSSSVSLRSRRCRCVLPVRRCASAIRCGVMEHGRIAAAYM